MTPQETAQQRAQELVALWMEKRARGIADTFRVGAAVVKVDRRWYANGEDVIWFFYINNVQIEQRALVQALTMLPAMNTRIYNGSVEEVTS